MNRDVWLVRHVGDLVPSRHSWGCVSTVDGVLVSAPAGDPGLDLADPAIRLRDATHQRIPGALRKRTRIEVGVVRTSTSHREYALVTCANVVVTLADHLWPELTTPWHGMCSPAAAGSELPVVLGPSAVLSLVAGALELSDRQVPDWLTARSADRSPYPPHDARFDWMRPMRTTRAARAQYQVDTTLPECAERPAVWVESLISLDPAGRSWQASLSLADGGGAREWLTQPVPLEIHAHDLLTATMGRVATPRPALDHDPVDGDSFGWAPTLLTTLTAGSLWPDRL